MNFNEWADYWRNDIGVNVIPAVSATKKPKVEWKYWQTNAVPDSVHEEWKTKGMFEDGMAVICGRCWHRDEDLWLNMIDSDNRRGVDELTTKKDGSQGTLSEIAEHTVVEQHSNKDKAHIYYYTKGRPMAQKTSDVGKFADQIHEDSLPAIEVKSGGNLLSYCAPGPHKDGSQIEIIGKKEPATVEPDRIENQIRWICKKYNLSYNDELDPLSPTNSVQNMLEENKKIPAGHNRSEGILRFVDSLRKHYPGMPREFYELNAKWFNQTHTTEPISDDRLQKNIDQALQWMDETIDAEKNEQWKQYLDVGIPPGDDANMVGVWMAEHIATQLRIINKKEIKNKLERWAREHEIKDFDVKLVINSVWSNEEKFKQIKRIAREYGAIDEPLILAEDQITEAGEYIKERYHIKQLELDGVLIFFNGRYYEYHAESLIRRNARECFVTSKNNTINEIVKYVCDTTELIDVAKIQEHAHLRCLQNGVYNIKTDEFQESFDPENILLNSIPHRFDESLDFAECRKVIEKLIPDEREREIFYDFAACCLHPYNGIKYQFGIVNIPGTGKTQLAIFLRLLVGEDNVEDSTIHKLASDATTQIHVSRKLLNIDGDLSGEDIKQVDVLKRWINHEPFTARGIYDQPVKFRPTARLMFLANQMYEIDREKDAEAIYDRTQLIKGSSVKIRGTNEDVSDIMANTAVQDELNGAVTFFLKRAHELTKSQKIACALTTSEVESVWNEFGNMIRQFVQTRLVRDVSGKIIKNDLFPAWDDFVYQKNFNQGAGSKSKLYKKFEEITGIEASVTRVEKDGPSTWVYQGYRLKTDEELEKDTQTILKTSS